MRARDGGADGRPIAGAHGSAARANGARGLDGGGDLRPRPRCERHGADAAQRVGRAREGQTAGGCKAKRWNAGMTVAIRTNNASRASGITKETAGRSYLYNQRCPMVAIFYTKSGKYTDTKAKLGNGRTEVDSNRGPELKRD